ncbi:hypothetical protein E2C01_059421 [Portunus trituberculatus]|uniref:Uncharacterized protein n=1 Tax=Portunus trituberculatus TaxID=210409 RepID=A0A5B7H8B1_PORTR|nr:hypothetical protein [Portunus trituberculatus]
MFSWHFLTLPPDTHLPHPASSLTFHLLQPNTGAVSRFRSNERGNYLLEYRDIKLLEAIFPTILKGAAINLDCRRRLKSRDFGV